MKWIKTFETFEFGNVDYSKTDYQNLMYYHCDDCDNNFSEANASLTNCPDCNSTNIEELSKEEFESLQESEIQDIQESFEYRKLFL